eukprot:6808029-Heterocapsa_arctica.AAC.2
MTLTLESSQRQVRQSMITHARSGLSCGHVHAAPFDPGALLSSPDTAQACSAAQPPFDLDHGFCRNVILEIICQWRAHAQLQVLSRRLAHSRRDDYRDWEATLAEHMRHAIASHDTAALWKYARILAGKRMGPH